MKEGRIKREELEGLHTCSNSVEFNQPGFEPGRVRLVGLGGRNRQVAAALALLQPCLLLTGPVAFMCLLLLPPLEFVGVELKLAAVSIPAAALQRRRTRRRRNACISGRWKGRAKWELD